MAFEEKEQQETLLIDLIEKVEKDPIPTNIFTVEDEDPLVLLGKMNEIISKLKDIRSIVQIANTNSNEALTKAEEAVTKAIESLNTATTSNATANNALATANNALAIAQNALQLAQMANDTAVEAIDTATQLGNEAKDTAQQAVETATTIGNEAKSIAQNALQVAQEALSQVTQGLGTKVMDVNGNLLANAKITGHNGINVDMDEEDPETFNIRLDETITKSIEDLNTQYNTLNDHYYYLIQTTLPNINSKIETNKSNIELLQNGQADNDIAIVNLQSKTLTHDEEIGNLQGTVTENSQKLQRALLTPMSAPTEQKIVGVGTDNVQDLLNLGVGLEVANGNIQIKDIINKIITFINTIKIKTTSQDTPVSIRQGDYGHLIIEPPVNDYTKDTQSGIIINGSYLSDFVVSYKSWTYGYELKFKSGLKAIYGSLPVGAYSTGNRTITYPSAFDTTTSYALLFSPVCPRGSAIYGKEDNPSVKYTTGFQLYWNTGIGITHYDFLAIGY